MRPAVGLSYYGVAMGQVDEQQMPPSVGEGAILVVDDDLFILQAIKRMLRTLGRDILAVTSSPQALEILEARPVSLLITDYMMPGIDGIQLLSRVREKWPGLPSILMTASSDIQVAADAVNRNLIDFFIPKPWRNEVFVDLAKKALARGLQDEAPKAGLLFGKYRLLDPLATGGMAELYRAELAGADGFVKKLVVKKVLPHLSQDQNFLQMFSAEARIMVTLSHGNIVSVLDFGEQDGQLFLVMEYVNGTDLRHLLDAPGVTTEFDPGQACHIARQVAQGLAYVHGKNDDQGRPLQIIHRDIAPQNILVSREGAVKITDFGIARAAFRPSHTATGIVRGTLSYMSYEQLCAQPIDHRTDIYALGAVLYEMLTGRPPYLGSNYNETVGLIARGQYAEAHKLNRRVPKEVSEAVDKALRRSPRWRYQTAAEFDLALERAMQKSGLHCGAADIARLVNQRLRPR